MADSLSINPGSSRALPGSGRVGASTQFRGRMSRCHELDASPHLESLQGRVPRVTVSVLWPIASGCGEDCPADAVEIPHHMIPRAEPDLVANGAVRTCRQTKTRGTSPLRGGRELRRRRRLNSREGGTPSPPET